MERPVITLTAGVPIRAYLANGFCSYSSSPPGAIRTTSAVLTEHRCLQHWVQNLNADIPEE